MQTLSTTPQARNSAAPSCAWCARSLVGLGLRIAGEGRSGQLARFCSPNHRQAHHRFALGCVARDRAKKSLRLAYADPPYPGLARRYYGSHPDYAGEVDHGALVSRLQAFDGWALSTSSKALPHVLALCVERRIEVSVAAWVHGARSGRSRRPRTSWQPVIYAGGRQVVRENAPPDSLWAGAKARLCDPERVTGAKPAPFVWWLFELLGALPGDELADLYPGSGGVSRAWKLYERAASPRSSRDASHLEDGHPSHVDEGHASREYSGHASHDVVRDASRSARANASRSAAGHASRGAAGGADASRSAAGNASRSRRRAA